jgi:hypothetical protein
MSSYSMLMLIIEGIAALSELGRGQEHWGTLAKRSGRDGAELEMTSPRRQSHARLGENPATTHIIRRTNMLGDEHSYAVSRRLETCERVFGSSLCRGCGAARSRTCHNGQIVKQQLKGARVSWRNRQQGAGAGGAASISNSRRLRAPMGVKNAHQQQISRM